MKAHVYQSDQASIFFMITELDHYAVPSAINSELNGAEQEPESEQESIVSTNMLMVDQLTELFDGELKYSTLNSGTTMVSLSLRVCLSSLEKQLMHDELSFKLQND